MSGYVLLLVLAGVVVARFGILAFPEGLAWLSGREVIDELDATDWGLRAVGIAAFGALQFILILGVGSVRLIPTGRVGQVGRVVSLVIVSGFTLMLTWVLVFLFWKFSGRDIGVESETLFFVGIWTCWFIIGVMALWRSDPETFIGRIFAVLLGTSWIEFVLALSLELVAPRDPDCPCDSGSWMALVLVIPIMLWSVGPAIVLLLFREWRLSVIDPRRPRRVLVRKSRRLRV